MRYILIVILFTMFGCRTNSHDEELARLRERAKNITIIRDDFGVPHIYGKTDADAVFGMLYAQCEDDFPRVERNYIWAIGRLAEVEGEKALYSDLRARLFMSPDEAKEEFEECPEWLKELCRAWADGINYYLKTHPEVQPRLLTHFEPWMPMYFSEGSIGGDIERVSTARIQSFYDDTESSSLSQLPDIEEENFPWEREPAGSNGFAISGEHTASGNAMLLINPHTSFYFRGEIHVVSEEGLNAYGAVTWGQFFVYQGFNEKTGWMHTSTYVDVIDEFKEQIENRDGQLVYQYGEEFRPVEEMDIQLNWKDGDGLSEKVFKGYRTHHGPLTHQIDDQWIATALMWNPSKALEQSFIRTKLNGHDEFWNMMKMNTNSSNNTVYADADGNIAYYHGNFIPIRDERFDYYQPVEGSNPETDWKGLHSVEEAITVVNPANGWIQNCNSTPYTSAGKYSPKRGNYPGYMSIDRENFRGIHAVRLLEQCKEMTLDDLIKMSYDNKLPAFEKLIPGLIKAVDRSERDLTIKEAIEPLRSWDYGTSTSSVAMTLAHFYGMAVLRNGNIPAELRGINRLSFFGKKAPDEEQLQIFGNVINKLEEDFGTWNIPWGEVNRFQRLSGDIDLSYDDDKPSIPIGLASGRWGALASYGSRSREGTKKLYGSSGNSFVAVVEFGDRVQAKSLLAGGQSGSPDSPHFYDQAQRYADVQFKDVAYYREDVESRAEETYQPGQRNL